MSTPPSSSSTVKSAVNNIQQYRGHSENAQKAGSFVAGHVHDFAKAKIQESATPAQKLCMSFGATICSSAGPIGTLMGGGIGFVFGSIISAAIGDFD